MKWHCGLLDERPDKSRTLNFIKRGSWGDPLFPPEIRRELEIWLAMPGFTIGWHEKTLLCSRGAFRCHLGLFDQYRAEVIENWQSATREDCIALARIRSEVGADFPLLVQLQIMRDLKAGATQAQVCRTYKATDGAVGPLARGRISNRAALPPGFELLIRPN